MQYKDRVAVFVIPHNILFVSLHSNYHFLLSHRRCDHYFPDGRMMLSYQMHKPRIPAFALVVSTRLIINSCLAYIPQLFGKQRRGMSDDIISRWSRNNLTDLLPLSEQFSAITAFPLEHHQVVEMLVHPSFRKLT